MEEFFAFLARHWILTSAFIFLSGWLISSELKRKLISFKELNPQDAVTLMNREEPVVIDLRDETEYKAGHIIHARHIPFAVLDSKLKELDAFRDRPVLVYCGTGQSSARAAALLVKEGFAKVFKLGGGLMAWNSANLPLKK